MLKVNVSNRLPPFRINSNSNCGNLADDKGPIVISSRSLRSRDNTSPSNSRDPYTGEQDIFNDDQDNNVVDVEYSPVDLSVACSSTLASRPTPPVSKLHASKTMSLLPQIWHICDLCDATFPSKFSLMNHFRKIHRIQRMPRSEKSPEVEIIPINLPDNNSYPPQESLADDIMYQPPSLTIRRMSNNSSSSNSNQECFVNSQQTSSVLFRQLRQFELISEICRVCSANFSDKKSLMSHMKAFHPAESRFGCSICGKVLSSRAALIGHMRIHTGEKPHVCNICNRAFSNSQTLTRHFRTHTKEQPYTCHICGKRASLRHNMKLHIKIHEKQMVYVGPGQS